MDFTPVMFIEMEKMLNVKEGRRDRERYLHVNFSSENTFFRYEDLPKSSEHAFSYKIH